MKDSGITAGLVSDMVVSDKLHEVFEALEVDRLHFYALNLKLKQKFAEPDLLRHQRFPKQINGVSNEWPNGSHPSERNLPHIVSE